MKFRRSLMKIHIGCFDLDEIGLIISCRCYSMETVYINLDFAFFQQINVSIEYD